MINDRIYLKLILNIRKNIPSSKIFYYIYFLFKYFGLILATQNLREYESKKYNITSLYSLFSKILLFDSSFNIISNSYQYICIIILILILSYDLFFLLIYIRLRNISINTSSIVEMKLNKYLNKYPYFKKELKIFSWILILISFISQLLEEFLFFGIAIILYTENNLKKNEKYLSKFFSTEIKINKLIIMICNCISFISCILIDFFIIDINDTKGFINQYGIDINSNKSIKIISLFLTFFQPVVGFSYIFDDDKKQKFRFLICIIAVCFCSIYLFLSFKKFTYYYDSQIPLFILFIVCFSWYSGIFEILMYIYMKESHYMTQKYSIYKLILILLSAYFIFFFIKKFNIKYFSEKLSLNLFKIDEKNRYTSEIYLYFKLFYMYRKEPSNFELYKILYFHKKKCQQKDCFCSLIEKKLVLKNIENRLKKEEYAIIGEQEIVNRINYLFKMKRFNREFEDYLILHCQYIYSIRNREYYAMYLCSMYLNCNLKLSLITKYFLYETKKEILNRIKSNQNNQKENFIISNRKNIEKNLFIQIQEMKKFIHFLIFSQNTKYFIKVNLNHLENILSFTKIFTKSKIGNMNNKSYKKFLITCNKVKLFDENIEKSIINYVKYRHQNDKVIKNYEMNYILSNYYILIHKKIPSHLTNKFNHKINFDLIKENIETDFNEFNMNYPLILSQNKTDNFTVSYCNNYLTNYLNYTEEEIIEKDFQDLIPYEIRKEHNLILKQFTLIHNGKFKSSNTYILNKENCLINISLKSRVFPTLYYFVKIITNINIIKTYEKSTISYDLFLDYDGYFLNISKEFEENFFFDIKRIKQLNISFNEFLGISPLEKKINNENIKYSLSIDNKAHSIFSNISNEKIFILRTIKEKIKYLQNKKYHFTSEVSKYNILNGINNINEILDEKGLDNEWYNRTSCLIERFTKYSYKNLTKINNRRKINKKNNISKRDNDIIFTLDYYLKEIGNKKYYIMKMKEKINITHAKESTKNLHHILTDFKKKSIIHLNTIQFQTKRSENSQKNLLRSTTNVSLMQNSIEDTFKNSNININIENSNLSPSLNGSLINSKLPFVDDSKNGFSSINLIQNLANNEIKRINDNHQNLNHNKSITQRKLKMNTLKYNFLNNSNIQKKFLENYQFFFLTAFAVVVILSFILLILKNKKINEHRELFQFNVYIEILKTDSYLSSLNSLTLCFQATFNSFQFHTQEFILPKILSLKDDLTKFYKYLNKIKGNNKLSILYNNLYKYFTFSSSETNWKIKTRKSTILDEINLILYYMFQVYYEAENNTCNYSIFINGKYLNFTKNDKPPSSLESLHIYGMHNTLPNFKYIFEIITSNSTLILIKYYENYFEFIFIYGICIILFTFICYFIIFYKLTIDKNEITRLLIYIFNPEENNINQYLFENRVYHLRLICENFNEKSILKFEIAKNKNIEYSHILNKPTKSRKSSIKSSKKQKNHQSNNQKKEENIFNDEEKNEIKKSIYLPKTVLISYLVLTICLIAISSIIIINIILADTNKKKFIFAIIMAMNFLERIPKACELSYYASMSFTLINETYIGTYYDYNEIQLIDDYLNYYNTEFEYNNNTQIISMKETYYPILYIEGKMVENNLGIFLGKKSNILTETQKWEKLFNLEDNICFASSLGSIYIYKENFDDLFYIFTMLNEKVKICYIYNKGCTKYGLLTEINYMYQELTNLYFDFINSNNRLNDYYYLLTNTDLIRIGLNFDYVLEFVFRTYCFFIMEDIGNLYNQAILIENILSICLLIVVFFVILYVFFFIDRGNNRYKKLFRFFTKMY